MSTWNYQIVRYRDGRGFGLHEVYKNKAGIPFAMTEDPIIEFHYEEGDTSNPEQVLKEAVATMYNNSRRRGTLHEPEVWGKMDDDE